MKRKSSSEKRLSANKSRLASPSPSKRRKWDENDQEEQVPAPRSAGPQPKIPSQDSKKQKISLTNPSGLKVPPNVPQPRSPGKNT
jgi:hypothetical protein